MLAPSPRTGGGRRREECEQVVGRLFALVFCFALLGCNTLLASYHFLQLSSAPSSTAFSTRLAGSVFLLVAPLLPCAALLVATFADGVVVGVWKFQLCSFVGSLCWYLWVLLAKQIWMLPGVVVLSHYLFIRHDVANAVLTVLSLFLCLVVFPLQDQSVEFAQEMALSVVLFLGSVTALPSNNSGKQSSRIAQHQQERQFFTLSLDDVNTAEAIEEISAAKRNKPGVWERVDYLKLADVSTLQINDQIGVGSFGNIYRASVSGSVVALKRIKTVKREFVESLLNEVDILSESHHPNIIQLLGWCDSPFVLVCFEFANGGNLHDFLLRSQLPVGWCAVKTKMAMDAASALAFLHNREVVHRDVKSENLLVFCNGNSITVKLGDFGCAVRRREQNGQGVVVGSSLWHAPEILAKGTDARAVVYTFATDVWAFGTTVCEICTHVPPWEDLLTGESLFQLNTCPAEQLKPMMSQFANIHVYERIVALVERCCSLLVSSEGRPTMNAVLFDLMQLYVAGDGSDEVTPSPVKAQAVGEENNALYALSNTNVEISPQYSPVFMDHRKRISDPTLSGQAFHRKRSQSRAAFQTPVRLAAAFSEANAPPKSAE
ncbi:hypothetical protein BASA81_010023 [Batrachochytrium salamandrivorans]|nr:hypothetical protein BASA81_010023 [Batrachochytrium salamandrivorans]